MKRIAFLVLMVVMFTFPAGLYAQEYGVYVKVIEKVEGGFENAVKSTEETLRKNDWLVLASYDSSTPEGCKFRAHNIVINSPKYSKQIMNHGPKSAFALPLRVGVYEDETGINIAFVNPVSINRTVLGDSAEKEFSVSTMNRLSDVIASAVKGNVVKKQIGELRTKGKVGGMGGGDFNDMIEEVYKNQDSGSLFQETALKVKEGILQNSKGWKIIYSLEFGEQGVIIYGVSNSKVEARAYKIAGEKRETSSYRFPGIDHAAAFPIEVIVYKEAGMVKVVTLDEMYRMKLYFEDAGKWAFMKNMRMPGDIEEEIVEMSSAKLK